MAYSDLFFITLGSITVGYGIGLGIKKVRASFKKAAGETQSRNHDETTQPNYWVNRLNRLLIPPKQSQRPDFTPDTSDKSPKAAPSS
ncbi:MAG: hypothetical protein EOM37_03995 [Proteobacteria bacterium]|jgi:hypothetical protein|nr:hypothetical protein [Alphaproteobacteria bacterium]NCC03197.1 hypothetical protein [Pseudomonadota bacterium]